MTRDAHYLLVGEGVEFIEICQAAASGCVGDSELIPWLDDISIFVSFKYGFTLLFQFFFPDVKNTLFVLIEGGDSVR